MLSKKEFKNEKLYQTTMFIARKMIKERIITENVRGLAGLRDYKSMAIVLSKAFGAEASLPFALHHPSIIPTLLCNRKQRKEKRQAATLLSKLKADFLKEVVSG